MLGEFDYRIEVEEGTQSPVRLYGLAHLGRVALRQGDIQAAVTACARSLAFQRRVGPSRFLQAALSVLALAAERGGLLALSARLSAAIAASKVPPSLDSPAMVHLYAEQQAMVERARVALGEEAFTAVWAAGETLSADAAIELGLESVTELQQLLDKDTAAEQSR